jgi:hypothetical protein
MKSNRFFKESNFYNWLIDNNITNEASANSYCSYVNSVNSELHFNDEVLKISNNQTSKIYSEMIEEILQVLSAKGFDKKINKAERTIGNWKSGIRNYGEFLVNNFQVEQENIVNDEITNKSLLINYETLYTKQDLYNNFTFRLITQDRFSGSIYFPISFIKMIFYKTDNRNYFDGWIKNILDNTVIHLENIELKLKQISNLYIGDEGVKMELKNKYYRVYTKHSNNIDKSPFDTKELRGIALDHSKPMSQIMNELKDELFELQKITVKIISKLKKRKISRPVLSDISKELISEMYLNKIDINQLKIEMDLISENSNLQLMDTRYNFKKRDFFL